MAEFMYRIPAVGGKPTIELPDFTMKDKKGNIKGTHVKRWVVRADGSMIEIVTDVEYKELKDYKV